MSADNRIELLMNGQTVVSNINTDFDLIQFSDVHNLTVYIGRKNNRHKKPDSIWRNPFRHANRHVAIAKFERYLWNNRELMARIHELRGMNLVCYCAPLACHGNILSELANSIK